MAETSNRRGDAIALQKSEAPVSEPISAARVREQLGPAVALHFKRSRLDIVISKLCGNISSTSFCNGIEPIDRYA